MAISRRDATEQVRGDRGARVACDVCGRTMLKGERAEPYLAPSRERQAGLPAVCAARAAGRLDPRVRGPGDTRAAAAAPERAPRRCCRRRRSRRRRACGPGAPAPPASEPPSRHGPSADERAASRAGCSAKRRPPRDPRHVRAVPDERPAEDRAGDRALQRLRAPPHGGRHRPHARDAARERLDVRRLGRRGAADGRVGAVLVPVRASTSRTADEPVRVRGQGQEIDELPEEAQDWNAGTRRGRTAAARADERRDEGSNGEEPERRPIVASGPSYARDRQRIRANGERT